MDQEHISYEEMKKIAEGGSYEVIKLERKLYDVSFFSNGVPMENIYEASSEEDVRAYFRDKRSSDILAGVKERSSGASIKPGMPIVNVPDNYEKNKLEQDTKEMSRFLGERLMRPHKKGR